MPDGVHPKVAGYALMWPVALRALDQAFEQIELNK